MELTSLEAYRRKEGPMKQIPCRLSFFFPPTPSHTFLLSHKWALPEADREPGGETKLLSLSQQQLMKELQQQIGFSNKLPSSLRLLPSSPCFATLKRVQLWW
ncbi:hypothetical protein NQZ68_032985 [Dissostichus eleginoides]|nr:hypothetical protein NQZ68_032985 [Dissostichus eleginoides]